MKRIRWIQTALVVMVLGMVLGVVQASDREGDRETVTVSVATDHGVVRSGQVNTAYLKVALRGGEIERREERTPVNVALVIDVSSSMSGEKIAQAREAARLAVDLLDEKDILSVVAYSDTVRVLLPATRVSDKREIKDAISQLQASGMTALFAGTSKGAAELRKFLDAERVNRVILLSDGQANVGPSTPQELGELGESLVKEGVSVTTIGLGLGYNEDLMVTLARRSDGNHAFVEDARQLAGIFEAEFNDVLSVVGQRVVVTIECPEGVRPVKVLGRDAAIAGNAAVVRMNQIYAGQEKFVLLEVELPASAAKDQVVAHVSVVYEDMLEDTARTSSLTGRVDVSDDPEVVAQSENREVAIDVTRAVANERNRLAITMRDAGNVEEAKDLLEANSSYLRSEGSRLAAPVLAEDAQSNLNDAEAVQSDEAWRGQRKAAVKRNYEMDVQQSY